MVDGTSWMIKADAISRKYGAFVAVNEVSFAVGANEIVGLLGHNGAGKTTIMKMMTGCLEPSSGRLTVDGLDVVNDRLAIQRQVGYLPENCPLYPDMTVVEYLEYFAALKSVPSSMFKERLVYALKKTSLATVATSMINTLSRGYRQRLGVAQAILHSPRLLILDEPTNGLDPSQILEMRSLIQELANSATLVISTHILQEVQAVCKRVIIINKGRLVLDETMDNLQSSEKILLTTSLEPDRFREHVGSIARLAVARHDKVASGYRYTIDLGGEPAAAVTSTLTRSIIDCGASLYEMQPLVRDLESIFREVSPGSASEGERT
jgi:ABC-2 type transport system ATP-binding protein